MSTAAAVDQPTVSRRGTTNRNVRGSSYARRRRREWLVETYRANVDVVEVEILGQVVLLEVDVREGLGTMYGQVQMACRCYRCGALLTVDTVTVDRMFPGIEGGTYSTPRRDHRDGRTNIRPSCYFDPSSTGGLLAAARRQGCSQ